MGLVRGRRPAGRPRCRQWAGFVRSAAATVAGADRAGSVPMTVNPETGADVAGRDHLCQGGGVAERPRRDETGDGVHAVVEENRVERRRRTDQDGVRVAGELDEPRRGLVDEAR